MRSNRSGRYVSVSDWSADEAGGVREIFGGNFDKLISALCSDFPSPFASGPAGSICSLKAFPTPPIPPPPSPPTPPPPPPPPSSGSAEDAPESLGVLIRFRPFFVVFCNFIIS
uniref:Uncharacterized protein n=1 Tax=Anopheles atroparvus TaxID=41427 RepID=A0A182JDE6_ANOAO